MYSLEIMVQTIKYERMTKFNSSVTKLFLDRCARDLPLPPQLHTPQASKESHIFDPDHTAPCTAGGGSVRSGNTDKSVITSEPGRRNGTTSATYRVPPPPKPPPRYDPQPSAASADCDIDICRVRDGSIRPTHTHGQTEQWRI